jgi:tetratricopeptide (TPR) repeat protein
MMMKRIFALTFAMLSVAGCSLWERHFNRNDYEKPQFYAKYLDPANPNDQRMIVLLTGLKANPKSAQMHNELGSLLVQKGFPKDAEREFERAADADRDFYPAWYNLGLIRAARGDSFGAYRAFRQTIRLKPGHSAAHFQLGLVEEHNNRNQEAIAHYAKAYSINPLLLDVHVNPRVLDSKLTHLALLKNYPSEHTKKSMQTQPAPQGYHDPQMAAPSRQSPANQIVPPVAPLTDPASQPAPPVTGT